MSVCAKRSRQPFERYWFFLTERLLIGPCWFLTLLNFFQENLLKNILVILLLRSGTFYILITNGNPRKRANRYGRTDPIYRKALPLRILFHLDLIKVIYCK